ncbi:DUF4832 domain-containing protein [bacterium]|nr:DUF4832 domain-containing protein [bacterium]
MKRFHGLLAPAALAVAALGIIPNDMPARDLVFTPSTATFRNPERGFYGFGELTAGTNFNSVRSAGLTLCYAPLDLSAYRTVAIPQSKLNDITAAFANMRAAGVKGIIRIVYNQDSSGIDTSLVWIEAHLQQLQPILAENIDMIAFYQAGVIGAWGEWHSSSNGLDNPAGRAAVWSLLVQYLPGCRSIGVRTPTYVYELEGANLPLAEVDRFGSSGAARIAHHNDCWLSTTTDMGTYQSASDRNTWLGILENDTRFVPWGGETCPSFDTNDNPLPGARATCTTAISELATLHGTYLNYYYHQPTLDQLAGEASTEYPAGCLTEISMRLGYRIELSAARVPDEIRPGQNFTVGVDLRNVGFAPVYNPRPSLLLLLDDSGALIEEYTSLIDLQTLLPSGSATTYAESFVAPSTLPAGPYRLALFFPDQDEDLRSDSRYSIRLANVGLWNATTGRNTFATDIPGPGGTVTAVSGWAIE